MAGIPIYQTAILPEWIDYNGHLTDSRYVHVFGEAMDALLRGVGVDAAYRAAGHAFYTAETHVRYRAEVKALETVAVETQILALDAKRLHVFHRLMRRDGTLAATGEQLYLHVDRRASKVEAMADPMFRALQRLHAAQARSPAPAAGDLYIRWRPGAAQLNG